MRTKSLFVIMMFILPLLLVSCGKDEMDDDFVIHDYRVQNVLYAKGGKLKQVSNRYGGETWYSQSEYEYDNLGRISKVSSPMYENEKIIGIISYNDYIYNSKDQLERIIYYNANTYAGFLNLQTHIYSYDNNGNKLKTLIEYPVINETDSILYFYEGNRLVREKTYRYGTFFDGDNNANTGLSSYTKYEYDNQGNLVKEENYSRVNDTLLGFSVHSYQDGLNVKTEVFVYYNVIGKTKLREIMRFYDKNDNLIYLESQELSILSSTMGYAAKYEYF